MIMINTPDTPNSTSNGDPSTAPPMRLGLDSPKIRTMIAAADVIRVDDPALGGGTVFFGREMLEEMIRTGIARAPNLLRLALDFVSDEPERLDVLIRELKGSSCFRPGDIFPEVAIDAASFSSAPDLLDAVHIAVKEVRT